MLDYICSADESGDGMSKTTTGILKKSDFCSISFAALMAIVVSLVLVLQQVVFSASWKAVGPSGGSFLGSVTSPTDANQITVVTTSSSLSNVYRSYDGGVTWTKIGEIPYNSYIEDVSAFDFSKLFAIRYTGCYRSTDGGVSWSYVSFPFMSGDAYCVCVDPTNPDMVYAAGCNRNPDDTYSFAFFKSTNGGQNWSASSFFTFDDFYLYDMAISKTNPDIIYVCGRKVEGSSYSGALFKTINGGSGWSDISSSVGSQIVELYSVAIDPTDEDRIYAGSGYLHRSTNGGSSWTKNPIYFYARTICIDPVNPSNIYVAGFGDVFVSTDYGVSLVPYYDCIRGLAAHVEVAQAVPSTVYVSTDAGLFKSTNSGSTWNSTDEGIYESCIVALAAAPSTVIVQNNGYLMAYEGSGNNAWRDVVTPPSCGIVCDILIDYNNTDIVLILEDYG